MPRATRSVEHLSIEAGLWKKQHAEIIVESAVSLTVNSENWLSFMCTPIDLEAMALGFLYNESIIDSMEEIASIRVCPKSENIDIWLNRDVKKPESWRRTSGCAGSITSVDNFENAALHYVKIQDNPTFSSVQIVQLIQKLFESQNLYRKSGGVHASALSDGQDILVVCEDIGRHNTLDKIAGRCILEKRNLSRNILLTTGRISSDMMQKASRLGSLVVISRTSPSSLSIQLANQWGISLIGYARRNHFHLYTHPERIKIDGSHDLS